MQLMGRLLVIFLMLYSNLLSAQNEIYNDSLRQSLLLMKQDDQQLRALLEPIKRTYGEPSLQMDSLWIIIHHHDSSNTGRLKEIVSKYGWPGNRLVGPDGAKAAFLILQHSDQDSSIQEEMLPLLVKSADNGDLDWQYVAYLTDRILVYKKDSKQLYGTQLRFNAQTRKWEPFPIEDEKNVDKRRMEKGMFSLEDYMNMINKEK